MTGSTDVAWIFPSIGHSANEDAADVGHPAHRGFREAIDADPVVIPGVGCGPFDGTLVEPAIEAWSFDVPTAEAFVLENPASTYAAPFIRSKNPDATIVQLAADLEFFGLQSYSFADDPFPLGHVRRAERWANAAILDRLMNRYVDGVIAVSDLIAETAADSVPDGTIEVVHPYVQPDLVDRLSEVPPPNLDAHHVLTVCEAREHKGVDLLVEAWPAVREAVPDATLSIVGDGHPDHFEDVPGVAVHGYVEDIVAEYERASLYVQPARADAFPVTVMEAMWAGRVPLVTESTGSRSLVSRIDGDLVVEPTTAALADGVIQWLEMTEERWGEISQKTRSLVKPISETEQQSAFKTAFEKVD